MSVEQKNAPIPPQGVPSPNPTKLPLKRQTTKAEAALSWQHFGFEVFPVQEGKKRPAFESLASWRENYSAEKIKNHWAKNAGHDVGIIIPEGVVVLDTDSAKGTSYLEAIEAEYNVTPNLAEETRQGQHHIFRLAEGVYAPTDTNSTEDSPEFIDVLGCGRQLIISPSTNKKLIRHDAKCIDELTAVSQGFIDCIFLSNSRPNPRKHEALPSPRLNKKSNAPTARELVEVLAKIDPDIRHDDWVRVGMAVYHETSGSDDGYKLFDAWSREGDRYKGQRETHMKWRSFRDVPNPVTIGTLIMMAKESDAGPEKIQDVSELEFEICETVVINSQRGVSETEDTKSRGTVFDKFSLTGMSEQLEKDALEQVPVLSKIALSGQITILCAEGGTGKTVTTMKFATESIAAGLIDPAKTYYLDMDDGDRGIIEKLKIAEEFGFHLLAGGHRDFSAKAFLENVRTLIDKDQARGVILILDTLKKFIDVMKKSDCRDFNILLREFTSRGGTVIALAHTNKNKGSDGRPIYGGTSDIKDDCDCLYLMSLISEHGAREKVVLFEREKSRGAVADRVCYSYISGQDITYNEMFLSVQEVEEKNITALQQAEEIRTDTELIDAVITCIKDGINTKMKLAEAAAKSSRASKRSVLQLIDKYTGEDPGQHRWFYVRGERGKMTYSVLEIGTE